MRKPIIANLKSEAAINTISDREYYQYVRWIHFTDEPRRKTEPYGANGTNGANGAISGNLE